jgi:phosphoribosylformylglycinamidine cyclo-ligase
VVERQRLLDGSRVRAGDLLLGVASSGPHANGFSLIRRILARAGEPFDLDLGGVRLIDALLAPTRIYVQPVLRLLADLELHAMAHITGGGLLENVIRVVPEGLALEIDPTSWPLPPVFAWIREAGPVAWPEMWRTRNCGIGFVLIIPPSASGEARRRLAAEGLSAFEIGAVGPERGGARVRIG